MIGIVIRRLFLIPPIFLLVSLVTFVLLRTTGNPVDIFLDINHTPEQAVALTQRLHLDQPLSIQYLIYLRDLVSGDFGESLQYGGPAIEPVLDAIVPTLQLMACGLGLAIVLGITGGIAAAVYHNRLPDSIFSTLALVGQSMPSFWLGILLIQLFALKLHWLPTSGIGGWNHLMMPSMTLAAVLLPNFLLVTRTAMIELMEEPFVATARAKGLPPARILLAHIFPNALNPLLSFLSIQIGTLIGGSVITETVFGWPGMGRLMITAVFNRDAPVVLAAVVFTSLTIIGTNLVVDFLQVTIDPRSREEG
jgi:peptide/nickel transport system permease protein/glutathione transport system permease protein